MIYQRTRGTHSDRGMAINREWIIFLYTLMCCLPLLYDPSYTIQLAKFQGVESLWDRQGYTRSFLAMKKTGNSTRGLHRYGK